MNSIYKNPLPIPSAREKKAEIHILVLYFSFFLMWLTGYLIGLSDNETIIFGLPLWFTISCIFAFIAIAMALIFTIKKIF